MKQTSGQVSQTLWACCLKRAFDLVAGGILLIVVSPLLLLTAILIKLTSPGPVLFVQVRGGLHGKRFRLVKFRTMRGDRTPDPLELVPLEHPEITPLGRILRRLKIDEFPQLWNVLRGEMSLVGPRPTLPDQIEKYDELRRQRLLVRPGVTGLAQVYGSAMMPWDERIMYDIAYVRRCSMALDCWVLLRTAWAVVVGEERASRAFASTKYAKSLTVHENDSLRPARFT